MPSKAPAEIISRILEYTVNTRRKKHVDYVDPFDGNELPANNYYKPLALFAVSLDWRENLHYWPVGMLLSNLTFPTIISTGS